MPRRTRLIALYGAALDFADGAIADAVALSEGASAAFVKETVRRLAQAALSSGYDNHVDRSTVAVILGEATESGNRIGRRIVGLPGAVQRAGRAGAPPLDGCGDDL
ncbi:hypothetical protein [Methylobacterium sp. BTF04]|uniref:hypothetical protein n=1 Tax=Methylobacterium sp. BTF04 TaxID=2708300 RepID=UPI001952AE71|nr:hypothetical protein [Methylobacterium sp. BTF04]